MEEEQENNTQMGIVLSGAIAVGTFAGCGIVITVVVVMLSSLLAL